MINHLKKKLFLYSKYLLLTLIMAFSPITKIFALKIEKIKNNKALATLESENLSKDQTLILALDNKKVAKVKVLQTKSTQVVLKILSGKLSPETTYSVTSGGSQNSNPNSNSNLNLRRSNLNSSLSSYQLSGLLRVDNNSLSVKLTDGTNNETVNLKGQSFGLTAALDYFLDASQALRLTGSYEQVDTKGSANFNSCNGRTSKDCLFKVSYLSFLGAYRYNLNQGDFQNWVAAGATLKTPISKSSTAIDTSSIKFAKDLTFIYGFDYRLDSKKQKSFIPFSLEYHYSLDTTSTVPTINQFTINIGYGILY